MRVLTLGLSLVMAGLLSACTTTDTPEGKTRVETWSWETRMVDGVPTTTESHDVSYVDKPTPPPEVELGGRWRLADYTDDRLGDRECNLDLTAVSGGQYGNLTKVIGPCDASMRNVAGWRAVGAEIGDAIILLDRNGRRLGDLDRVQKGQFVSLYRGVFELANGEVVKVHLSRW